MNKCESLFIYTLGNKPRIEKDSNLKTPGRAEQSVDTGPRCAVGNVSGNRCESDCRYRGREYETLPGPILSCRLIMKQFLRSFSSLPLNYSRRVVVSYKRKYVHKVLVNIYIQACPGKSVVR